MKKFRQMLTFKEEHLLNKLKEHHPFWITLVVSKEDAFKKWFKSEANALPQRAEDEKAFKEAEKYLRQSERGLAEWVKGLGYKQPFAAFERLHGDVGRMYTQTQMPLP